MPDIVTRRIQWKPRTRGGLPPGARWVGRPSRFGNPVHLDDVDGDHAAAVLGYIHHLEVMPEVVDAIHTGMPGWDAACRCDPGQPCHGDVVAALANATDPWAALRATKAELIATTTKESNA